MALQRRSRPRRLGWLSRLCAVVRSAELRDQAAALKFPLGGAMANTLQCAYCGRKLPAPPEAGPVKCDGCKCPFDPAKLRYRPACLPRRVAGWVLLALGVLLLLSGLSAALKYDYRTPNIVMKL